MRVAGRNLKSGAVSKTVGRRKAARGFESHPLRFVERNPLHRPVSGARSQRSTTSAGDRSRSLQVAGRLAQTLTHDQRQARDLQGKVVRRGGPYDRRVSAERWVTERPRPPVIWASRGFSCHGTNEGFDPNPPFARPGDRDPSFGQNGVAVGPTGSVKRSFPSLAGGPWWPIYARPGAALRGEQLRLHHFDPEAPPAAGLSVLPDGSVHLAPGKLAGDVPRWPRGNGR